MYLLWVLDEKSSCNNSNWIADEEVVDHVGTMTKS